MEQDFATAGIGAPSVSEDCARKALPERVPSHWRPRRHFSPARNWMNDPNGMVYLDGVFHLFFQYNPGGSVWGDIHWGHAVSRDLLHWQEKPVALASEPDGLGMIFSGGAVVDWENTSGFQRGETPPVVATFTHHDGNGVQVQSLAISTDGGWRWEKYADNPVIPNPGIKDFRDPKVFWHASSRRWVMVLAAGDRVHFYRSRDLKEWEFLGDFGEKAGDHGGVWECPDLFPLKTPEGEERWCLLVSINPGGPNGGSATQYFIGDFDGERFVPEHQEVRWLDYGTDNYAGVTWDGLQGRGDRRILVGWMSNWDYANKVPTEVWRGAMTLPRELYLYRDQERLLLGNRPVTEVQVARTLHSEGVLERGKVVQLPGGNALDLSISVGSAPELELEFLAGDGERLLLTLSRERGVLLLDRRESGWVEEGLGREIRAPLVHSLNHDSELRVVIDGSAMEIFVDGGKTALTAVFFSSEPLSRLAVLRAAGLSPAYSLYTI
ncbi:glycoside hydrolase family 32 protein [Microbulbifer thermotolerans]|uniref:glycoside hydrolase family 32 protein n=1 Tax=Microbulbifer thermotolerans TaxID=252514 RepID=UPI00224B89CE|nr:glycoside hydrolase family 32 protein [Microbulbifer thermotolerans]MCX2781439.1 glycoside hydrolase family 32 protein [Microbulbifer thermotolerans]